MEWQVEKYDHSLNSLLCIFGFFSVGYLVFFMRCVCTCYIHMLPWSSTSLFTSQLATEALMKWEHESSVTLIYHLYNIDTDIYLIEGAWFNSFLYSGISLTWFMFNLSGHDMVNEICLCGAVSYNWVMCAMLRNITTSKEDYLDRLLEVVSQMDKMEERWVLNDSSENFEPWTLRHCGWVSGSRDKVKWNCGGTLFFIYFLAQMKWRHIIWKLYLISQYPK